MGRTTRPMNFRRFEQRAAEIFDEIPPEFREGVDGLVVDPEVKPHPELPEIFTLGECVTEQYPSDFGGPGSIRSFVVVYHGSFRELARRDEAFDWEAELWETITHEVRHHLESLAAEDALEVEDWVMDQNFARREGKPFDAGFYRGGIPVEPGVYEVDGDLFIEVEVGSAEVAAGAVELERDGRRLRVPLPEPLGEASFLILDGLDDPDAEGYDTVVVPLRRRGVWDAIRAALRGATPVEERRVRVEPLE